MKKINYIKFYAIIILLCISPVCWAQLTVNSDGSVVVADSCNSPLKLKIGEPTSNVMYSNAGLHSTIRNFKAQGNVGVIGEVYSTNYVSNAYAAGVCGVSGNGQTGYNYGTIGVLSGNYNGAGVFGTTFTSGNFLSFMDGRYAGYFSGMVKINGDSDVSGTAYYHNASYYSSDERLKSNIISLSETTGINVLPDIMKIKTYKFNYAVPKKALDEAEKDLYDADYSQRTHFGVMAQELQEIYPNLVKEKSDGYLAVNYVELVPLLINAVQELKKEIAELKGEDISLYSKSKSTTAIDSDVVTNSQLFQNSPNPFKESTVIRFSVADAAKSASLCIFNMEGKMLKTISLANNDKSITINSGELNAGMYLYTLIVDGKEIDTKRMILTK